MRLSYYEVCKIDKMNWVLSLVQSGFESGSKRFQIPTFQRTCVLASTCRNSLPARKEKNKVQKRTNDREKGRRRRRKEGRSEWRKRKGEKARGRGGMMRGKFQKNYSPSTAENSRCKIKPSSRKAVKKEIFYLPILYTITRISATKRSHKCKQIVIKSYYID